jgi:hypothetical protein
MKKIQSKKPFRQTYDDFKNKKEVNLTSFLFLLPLLEKVTILMR